MNFDLPKKLNISGKEYAIRYDYRCILDILSAMEDPELDQQDKSFLAMIIFYQEFDDIPPEHYQDAIKQCFWFINGGQNDIGKKGPKLISWEHDIKHIIAPVNRILGREIRDIPYDEKTNTGGLHWWTFLSAYMEIGDCLFAQIVRIRDLKARGKPLDKSDQEWYTQNRDLVDFKHTLTDAENDVLLEWGVI